MHGLAVRGKARPAEGRLVEPVALDHRAHGAVDDQDALARGRLQRGDALLACHALTASLRAAAAGLRPEQVADGVDEVGAVQRVEVELADALIEQVHHLLGRHDGRHEVRGLRIVVEAVEAARHPGRHGRAAAPGKPATCAKLCIGTMPGTIGTLMPCARAASRKRR